MATLGRSLKSPSGLMRAGRPSLARALSSSSEVSVASADSGRDDEHMDFVMSAPNTPFGEPSHSEAVTSIASEATTSHSHRGKSIYSCLSHFQFCLVGHMLRASAPNCAPPAPPLSPLLCSVPTPRRRRRWPRSGHTWTPLPPVDGVPCCEYSQAHPVVGGDATLSSVPTKVGAGSLETNVRWEGLGKHGKGTAPRGRSGVHHPTAASARPGCTTALGLRLGNGPALRSDPPTLRDDWWGGHSSLRRAMFTPPFCTKSRLFALSFSKGQTLQSAWLEGVRGSLRAASAIPAYSHRHRPPGIR